MAVPASREARRFYRCAEQRFSEAQVLLRAGYTTGAVYLAGYGVECMLKALIFSMAPSTEESVVLESFRGRRAHDYGGLIDRYSGLGGALLPRDVNRSFTLVRTWSTDLRYSPLLIKKRDATDFMQAAKVVMEWANGRL